MCSGVSVCVGGGRGSSALSNNINRYLVFIGEANAQLSLSHLVVLDLSAQGSSAQASQCWFTGQQYSSVSLSHRLLLALLCMHVCMCVVRLETKGLIYQ